MGFYSKSLKSLESGTPSPLNPFPRTFVESIRTSWWPALVFAGASWAVLASQGANAAHAASLCDGLRGRAVQSESLYDPGQPLAGVYQAPHQNTLTGCWARSPYSAREACHRNDRFGQLNARFGSCATYSGFSTALAVANVIGLQLPQSLQYEPANLVRLYDLYGNAWDIVRPGEGDFLYILHQVAGELENDPFVASGGAQAFRRLAQRYRTILRKAPRAEWLLGQAGVHFDRREGKRLLPAQAILDGWVLDHLPSHYCPVRNQNGYCDLQYGRDQRSAHSTLLVGRRIQNGVCQALVRNSWRGTCRGGSYGVTGRECLADHDSVWIPEAELAAGLDGITGVW